MDSPCHPGFTTTNLSYRLPIFETSATALCGTTGIGCIIEGSLEVKLPTIWTDEKAEAGRAREETGRREKIREEEGRRKKIKVRGRVAETQNRVFFQCFGAPEGRKVGSLKRRVRSQLPRWEMKIARRCGAKHIWKSKCAKHTRFGALLEVEVSKVHAVVAWSNHCYLSYIISGGVTYQNNFPEIVINFMREPYTSGIGQTMQKYFLG